MAILSSFIRPASTPMSFMRDVAKYGVGSLIGVILTYFLASTVIANQHDTLAAIHEHQRDAQAQLEVLRLICASLADGDPIRIDLCRTVGRRAE